MTRRQQIRVCHLNHSDTPEGDEGKVLGVGRNLELWTRVENPQDGRVSKRGQGEPGCDDQGWLYRKEVGTQDTQPPRLSHLSPTEECLHLPRASRILCHSFPSSPSHFLHQDSAVLCQPLGRVQVVHARPCLHHHGTVGKKGDSLICPKWVGTGTAVRTFVTWS